MRYTIYCVSTQAEVKLQNYDLMDVNKVTDTQQVYPAIKGYSRCIKNLLTLKCLYFYPKPTVVGNSRKHKST